MTYLRKPQGASYPLSKFGFQTQTSGTLKVRVNSLVHSRDRGKNTLAIDQIALAKRQAIKARRFLFSPQLLCLTFFPFLPLRAAADGFLTHTTLQPRAQIRAPLADDLNAIVRRARERLAAARNGGLPGIGPLAHAAEPSVTATLDRLALASDEALTEEEKEAERRRKEVEAMVARAKGGAPGQFGIQAELHADPEGAQVPEEYALLTGRKLEVLFVSMGTTLLTDRVLWDLGRSFLSLQATRWCSGASAASARRTASCGASWPQRPQKPPPRPRQPTARRTEGRACRRSFGAQEQEQALAAGHRRCSRSSPRSAAQGWAGRRPRHQQRAASPLPTPLDMAWAPSLASAEGRRPLLRQPLLQRTPRLHPQDSPAQASAAASRVSAARRSPAAPAAAAAARSAAAQAACSRPSAAGARASARPDPLATARPRRATGACAAGRGRRSAATLAAALLGSLTSGTGSGPPVAALLREAPTRTTRGTSGVRARHAGLLSDCDGRHRKGGEMMPRWS